jgi:TrmH family RNA methyltransferase
MLSKTRISYIISLQKRKFRDEYGIYVIEGDKLVKEYMEAGMPVEALYAKSEWLASTQNEIPETIKDIVPVSYEELKRISSLTTPHNAMALVRIEKSEPPFESIISGYSIALESVQDPGNLGTIIRSAAWFGIPYIICTTDSVDCFNPKVVQSTMGGLMKVRVLYHDLSVLLGKAREESVPVFGTYPDGLSIYDHNPPEKGIILFGNESKGISKHLDEYISTRLSIPRGRKSGNNIDSLNVAMSVSIMLSEFGRKLTGV